MNNQAFDKRNTNRHQPPTFDGQNMHMWGNDRFAGEDILRGDNFNAPADFEEITDAHNADISVNFAQENFGGFDMMPPAFNRQGGQFNQHQHFANKRK